VRLCLEALEDRTLLSNPATTGELITAIQNANNNPGTPTTITLAANTTFDFTSANNSTNGANALPVITANITIVGNGDTLERSGPATFRLFDVASNGTLTLENLTLTGGLAQGAGVAAEGGAVYNAGTLTLNHVTVQSNQAQGSKGADAAGGGLYVAAGSVTLTNDTLSGNHAQGGNGGNGGSGVGGGKGGNGGSGGAGLGGALYVDEAGSVTLSNDTLSGNHAQGGNGGNGGSGSGGSGGSGGNATGGGLYIVSGSTTILANTLIAQNTLTAGTGGTSNFSPRRP
jgi:hypothetical protein